MIFIVLVFILASGTLSNAMAKKHLTFEKLARNLGKLFDDKINQIETDIDAFNLIHGGCAPCLVVQGTKDYCDCRNLEIKKDCLAFYQAGIKMDGLYKISGPNFSPSHVFCDQTTQGGGWTIIQRRKDGSENFFRNWNDYKRGFGDLKGEFWFGNDNINELTENLPKSSTLLINMKLTNNPKSVWAKYKSFSLTDESTKYTLRVSGFTGNTTDALAYHNNGKFSTFDQDNDGYSAENRANVYKGAWWYNPSYDSNLNGLYAVGNSCVNINWHSCSVQATFVEIKVKRNL